MRNVTMLVGGMLMAMTLSVQAAEMQHDGHGQMMEMNAEQAVIQGTGVVQSVDKTAKKITIAHEAIPAIGWPAMTMRFTYTEPTEAINQLKAGSHVNFSFIQQWNLSLLQDIKSI